MSVGRIKSEWAARGRNPVAAMTTLPEGFSATIVPQPWIPVSERLPEVEQNVLAAVAGEVGIAHRYVDGWFWDVNEWSRPFTPTHWMPLPEPPAS